MGVFVINNTNYREDSLMDKLLKAYPAYNENDIKFITFNYYRYQNKKEVCATLNKLDGTDEKIKLVYAF